MDCIQVDLVICCKPITYTHKFIDRGNPRQSIVGIDKSKFIKQLMSA